MPSSGSKSRPGESPTLKTDEFFLNHPVFSLDTFRRAGERHGLTRTALGERVKYGLERGRLKLLAKRLCAVVPPGVPADDFAPDRVLVPTALAPDAVLAYHSALEALGFAHSVTATCITSRRGGARPSALPMGACARSCRPGPFARGGRKTSGSKPASGWASSSA